MKKLIILFICSTIILASVESFKNKDGVAETVQVSDQKHVVTSNVTTALPIVNVSEKHTDTENQDITPKSVDETSQTESESNTTEVPEEPKTALKPNTTTIPTQKSITSTLASATTTPKSIPIPASHKWILNETNTTCIVLQMALQIKIAYTNSDKENTSKVFNLPTENVTVTGECSKIQQTITLEWKSEQLENNSLSITFVNNKTKNYSLHSVKLIISSKDLPTSNLSNNIVFMHDSSEFSTSIGNSYRCLKQQQILLNTSASTNGTFKGSAMLMITDLQFEAFKQDKTSNFGLAEDCAFDTPDYVPIGVGCALAILVVIVLIGYLVGRRRRQAQGYLSM